jgi:hypothetical protein
MQLDQGPARINYHVTISACVRIVDTKAFSAINAAAGPPPVLYYDGQMRRRNLLLLMLAIPVAAQDMRSSCANCAAWNKPHPPFKIYGNTYYVGTDGLSSIPITSKGGHILVSRSRDPRVHRRSSGGTPDPKVLPESLASWLHRGPCAGRFYFNSTMIARGDPLLASSV